jgi:hypothetical protein
VTNPCAKHFSQPRGLVSASSAPVVVAITFVCTLPRAVVPAPSAIPTVAFAGPVSAAEGLVVRSAGSAIVAAAAATAPVVVTASSSATVASVPTSTCAIATEATTSRTARTGGSTGWSTVRRSVAVRLVADTSSATTEATTSSSAAESSSATTEASACSIASKATTESAATSTTSAESTTAEASATASEAATRAGWRSKATGVGRSTSSRTLGVASTTKTTTETTWAPSGNGAAALDIDQDASVLDLDAIRLFVSGLHVFLALEHDECVAALPLFEGRVGGLGDVLDDANALNGTVAAELALDVVGGDAIGEAGDEECLEGVALNFGVLGRFICIMLAHAVIQVMYAQAIGECAQ